MAASEDRKLAPQRATKCGPSSTHHVAQSTIGGRVGRAERGASPWHRPRPLHYPLRIRAWTQSTLVLSMSVLGTRLPILVWSTSDMGGRAKTKSLATHGQPANHRRKTRRPAMLGLAIPLRPRGVRTR